MPEASPFRPILPRHPRNSSGDVCADADRVSIDVSRHVINHGLHRRQSRRHRRLLVHVSASVHTHPDLWGHVSLHTGHYAAEGLRKKGFMRKMSSDQSSSTPPPGSDGPSARVPDASPDLGGKKGQFKGRLESSVILVVGKITMTLTRSIEISAERDYGPLTKELRKLIAKISFRVPLEKALQYFADRTGTQLARRSAMLISEANKSGGDIQESMESVAKHVQEIQYLERKRRASMRPFIGVMYISFAVFIVTVYLLIKSFFTQLANTNFGGGASQNVGGVGFNFVSLPLDKITAVFLYMAMIEAILAGLVGGKMATGYLKDGLKHAVILMSICFITFVFFI